jgi:hypothetical protein
MTLEDAGPDSWRHCAALEVEESQRPFVASVPYYLALCAYDESPWRPIAVRVANEVVGFVSCWYGPLWRGIAEPRATTRRSITVVFARRRPGVDCDGPAVER